jgi:hypothetical protein
MDAVDDPSRIDALALRAAALDLPFFRISAVTGQGVPALLEAAWTHMQSSGATGATGASGASGASGAVRDE